VFRKDLALIIGSTLLFSSSAPALAQDPMQAHDFKEKGPWFEGWYTRIVDRDNHRSFAVITTSAIGAKEKLPADGPPGYVALIAQSDEFNGTLSFESFPERTHIGNRGSDFEWSSPEHGNASKLSTDIAIAGSGRIQITVSQRAPWSLESGHEGPEGNLATLPFMPLHWFVYNVGGEGSYSVDIVKDGKPFHFEGRGEIHQEKNWGKVFPDAWMWLQAKNDSSYIALAGGDLKLGPLKAHSYMIGYRSATVAADFNAGQGFATSFGDKIDSCGRKFSIEAKSAEYKLVIEAEADPATFTDLSIPTKNGYERNGAIESFVAKIKTRIYRNRGSSLLPKYDLIEEQVFEQAGLEFGAKLKDCD
jgi:Tocopherol cyclase